MTGTTTCARNSSFVRWQDGAVMFGVRFAKEDQAEKVFVTGSLPRERSIFIILS